MEPTPEPLPDPLARLVLKQGLAIGGLSPADRDWALALAWGGLPPTELSEPEVNRALKAVLGGMGTCLGADHVELRRWLVDGGWLQRDGFGRVYRRVPAEALPETLQPVARALDGVDLAGRVDELRARHEATRAARRAAWERRQDAGAAAGSSSEERPA